MDQILRQDLMELERLLERTKDETVDYLKDIQDIPTSVASAALSRRNLNDEGLGGLAALKEFRERYRSIIVGSSGPRFWGFVTGGATPASIMGDWLASAYDQNTQSVSGSGDISGQIELEAIDLFLELLGLPKTFKGGFATGAMMSNFTCLATARQWLGHEQGMDIAKKGLSRGDVLKVLSATPHSSTMKALALLGIGKDNLMPVPTMGIDREAIDIEALEQQIQSLNGIPFILVTSAATVNTGDFDDFVKIAELRTKYRFWWHIDAAFGGLVGCSPKYNHLVEGWEHADSITVDCHKWLNVPYENAVFFIKEEHQKYQVETFQNSNAPYLGNISGNLNFLDLLPENSRRLKALPVWFSLVAYGKQGYTDIVENSIHLAQKFGKWIQDHDQLELLAPIHLNIVPFTIRNTTEGTIDRFLDTLNFRGKIFMTPTVFNGQKGVRAAFVNWRTTLEDIEMAMEEIENTLQIIGLKQ